jgi:hypothetical protein
MKSVLSALASLFLVGGLVHAQKAEGLSGVAISPPNNGWFI